MHYPILILDEMLDVEIQKRFFSFDPIRIFKDHREEIRVMPIEKEDLRRKETHYVPVANSDDDCVARYLNIDGSEDHEMKFQVQKS